MRDLRSLVLAALNPEGLEVNQAENDVIDEQLQELQRKEGLLNATQVIHHGFITRGNPLVHIQRIAGTLAKTRGAGGRAEL